VRAAAAGSERLLGGAAVPRRTLRGFVSVPSTSNSASTLPLILGDGLRAGVARAESRRRAAKLGEKRRSTIVDEDENDAPVNNFAPCPT